MIQLKNSDKIRLLIIISDITGGGAERVVSTILKNMDREKFELMLCLWRDIIAYPIPDDVCIKTLGKYNRRHMFRTIWRTRLLINKWKPDIIYSHLTYVNLLTGLSLLAKRNAPIWIPCEHVDPEFMGSNFIKRIMALILKRSYKVITVSKGVRDACVKLFSLPENKVITVYNPLELPDARTNNDDINHRSESYVATIVAMGRLSEQKDYPTLLRAIKLISEKMAVNLKILGDGPLKDKLETLAANLGIKENVEFLGFDNDPFRVIRSSDVYIMSSIYEGLPTALIEAMACGVPVVSTRATYGPEEIIVDGESGLLVDVGDSDALANATLKILKNPYLQEEISKAGILRAKALFSKEKLIPCLEDIFIDAVSEKRLFLERTDSNAQG